jgi:hypothetical protein
LREQCLGHTKHVQDATVGKEATFHFPLLAPLLLHAKQTPYPNGQKLSFFFPYVNTFEFRPESKLLL